MDDLCSVDGCAKARYCKGMCRTHYNQTLPNRHRKVEMACTYCGATLLKFQAGGRQPFCDYTCRDLYRIENPYGTVRVRGIAERIPASHPARWYGSFTPITYTECPCGALICHPEWTAKVYCSSRCKRRAKVTRRGGTGYRRWAGLVYERDDYMCWLCGTAVDMDKTAPHRLAPTLDHLDTKRDGGSDDPDNLATAHFECNSRRGSRSVTSLPAPAA